MTEDRRKETFSGRPGVILFLFILLGTGIYWNSLENGFHYDDHHHILQNPLIKTPANIPYFFTDPRAFSLDSQALKHYRPVILSSYSLNYALGEFSPRGYHLVNLGFHIGSAFFLFLILREMLSREDTLGKWIPPAAGLLFLTTPFNTEVVNYISARSSVMTAFFLLVSFWLWMKYREAGGGGPATRFYIAALSAFLLAILTKESAVIFPILLWFYDRYFHRHGGASGWLDLRSFLPYLPFAAVAGIIGILVRIAFFHQVTAGSLDRGLQEQIFTQAKILSRTFWMPLFPAGLSLDHGNLLTSSADAGTLLSVFFLLALLAWAWLLGRKSDLKARILSFFILWFFIVLLPTTVVSLLAIFQENRGYLSAVAVAAMVGTILVEGVRRLPVSPGIRPGIAAGLLILLLAAQSWGVMERNTVWRDDYTLWTDVLKKNPGSSSAHLALGGYYYASGQWAQSEQEYFSALAIDSGNGHALNNLGLLYARLGQMEKARKMFEEAVRLNPWNAVARQNLATLQMETPGDLDQAKGNLERAMAVQSTNPEVVRQLLVGIYERQGNFEAARVWLTELLRKDPYNPALHFGMGLIYKKDRDFSRAKKEFTAVLRKIPRDVTTLLELAIVHSELGETHEAERILEEVRRLEPENPQIQEASRHLSGL